MAPLLERLPRRTVLRAVLCLALAGVVVGIVAFAMTGRAGTAGRPTNGAETQAASTHADTDKKSSDEKSSDKKNANTDRTSTSKKGAPSEADAGQAQLASETLEPDGPRYEIVDEGTTDTDDASDTQSSEPARLTIPEGSEYVPNVVLVSVDESATPEEVNALIAQSGTVVPREVSADEIAEGYIKLDVAEGASVEDAMNELASSDAVDSAQPNFIYYAMLGDESDFRARLGETLAAQADGLQTTASDPQTTASDQQTTASDPQSQGTEGDASADGADEGSLGGASQSGDPAEEGGTSASASSEAADEAAATTAEGEVTSAEPTPAEPGSADAKDVAAAGTEATTESDITPADQLLDASGASLVPSDPRANEQWALASMHVYEAWALARCEGKVGIAVLDGGAQYGHEDLKTNVKHIYDVATESNTYSPYYNHGTGVAGITGATASNGKGVAGISYNANLMIVNTLYMYDGELSTTTGHLAKAINYVTDNASRYNIRVINLSLGALYSAAVHQVDQAIVDAINNAYKKGIVVVAAAGNRMTNAEPPYDVFPGDLTNVVSVINLQRNGTGVSRYGSSNYNKSGQKNKNISAPGASVLKPQVSNAYGTVENGTSFSAPQVSGILALEFAANPKLTPAQAVSILYSTATDIGPKGFDDEFGYGEANAYEAVRAAKDGASGGSAPAGSDEVEISTEVPTPVAKGATKVPVGATAAYTVKDGSLKLKSGGSCARLDGTTLTGLKAGTATLGVYDKNGKERSTITVQVFATSGAWLLASSMGQSFVADVSGGSVLNGGNAILYKSNGGNNQVWLLEKQGSGGFVIRNAKSGKVLDVKSGSKASGANVLQYAAGGKSWQRWKIRVQQDNTLLFVNENSGRVLEVDGGTAANKRNIRQATQTGTARQKWVLKKVKADIGAIWDGEYRISSRLNAGFALDVAHSSKANGGNVILYKWKGGNNQRWHIQYLGNGVYKIYNVNSRRVLDVAAGSLANGANIVQWGWGNKANQRWNLKKNSDGSYTIMRVGTSRVVAVSGTSAANGHNICQYGNANAANRHWTLKQF